MEELIKLISFTQTSLYDFYFAFFIRVLSFDLLLGLLGIITKRCLVSKFILIVIHWLTLLLLFTLLFMGIIGTFPIKVTFHQTSRIIVNFIFSLVQKCLVVFGLDNTKNLLSIIDRVMIFSKLSWSMEGVVWVTLEAFL